MFDTTSTHACTRTPSVQTHQSCVGVSMVVDLFIFIHPDLCGSHAVCQSFAPWVRGLFREHMTHMGARVDLQAAPTLPNLRDINNTTTSTTTRIWLAPQPWFNHSLQVTQSTALLWRSLETEKLFCCWREIFLVPSLWEIAVIREKGCSNSSL